MYQIFLIEILKRRFIQNTIVIIILLHVRFHFIVPFNKSRRKRLFILKYFIYLSFFNFKKKI
jgi:hypothetical protein